MVIVGQGSWGCMGGGSAFERKVTNLFNEVTSPLTLPLASAKQFYVLRETP